MKFWFFPVKSGDFRIEKSTDDSCLLTVEDPTPKDKVLLDPFLVHARKECWIETSAGILAKGKSEILVHAPLSKVGTMLAMAIHGDADTWTAVRYVDGAFSVGDLPVISDQNADKQLPAVPEVAAVTLKKPKKGCPAPTPAERRASEVLQTFCTASQWGQLLREGRLTAIGSHTGRAYHVYHRDQAANQGLLHSLVLRSTGREICCWDDTVPAEEEVLSIKLAIEHRERWLLDLVN